LDGFPAGSDAADAAAALGPEAVAILKNRVDAFGHPQEAFPAPDGPPQPQEALRQLLGSHADYASEPRSMAAMDMSRLALPATADSQVEAFVGDKGDSYSVDGFCKRYVLPNATGRECVTDGGFHRPYMDPVISHSAKNYGRLLGRLVKAGIVEFTSEHGVCTVGLFAVSKKDGRQRLVVNARQAACPFPSLLFPSLLSLCLPFFCSLPFPAFPFSSFRFRFPSFRVFGRQRDEGSVLSCEHMMGVQTRTMTICTDAKINWKMSRNSPTPTAPPYM